MSIDFSLHAGSPSVECAQVSVLQLSQDSVSGLAGEVVWIGSLRDSWICDLPALIGTVQMELAYLNRILLDARR